MQHLLLQRMARQKRSFKKKRSKEETDILIGELAELLVEGFLWQFEHREDDATKEPIPEEGKGEDTDQYLYL